MNQTEVLEAITSNDNHQAWLGSWEIIRTPVSELKDFYIKYLKIISSAIQKLPKPEGTYLRDSRDVCILAVKILELAASGQCRCVIYTSSDQLLPENEERYGFVKIENKEDIPWEPEFTCKCTECGRLYMVKENYSYYYPWAKWAFKNA
jgi:hypothetical protein